ncbi:hypothetical protein N7461_005455 [Penicillium sp. DV-2018c]|nr:hypothetical protein N7461_005455 [Penicillium sp. DV-2018c]
MGSRTPRNVPRLDYEVLNGGPDSPDGGLPSDQLTDFDVFQSSQLEADHTSTDQDSLLLSEVLPQDSASQSQSFLRPVKKARAAPATQWIWNHFSTREVARAWAEKRTGKKRTRDMDISCTVVDGKTGKQCGWATADSQRAQSTSNMQRHLAKSHSILPPESQGSTLNVPDIRRSFKKQGHLTVQDCLERNILRWIIQTKQPFCVLEAASFQQTFADLPGISLPYTSRSTVRRRLADQFELRRAALKEELAVTCGTISYSLDIWTSQNHHPILGIIGHWLTEDFHYREEVIEFCELQGSHTGVHMAAAVYQTLVELDLTTKLTTITGDNATNVQDMVSRLSETLAKESFPEQLRFHGGDDGYVRCLAHILNLIVKDILKSLRSGSLSEAHEICDGLESRMSSVSSESALSRLRIFAVCVSRSTQRRQEWSKSCASIGHAAKFIEYDVDTRWNSTFRLLDDGLKSRAQIDLR